MSSVIAASAALPRPNIWPYIALQTATPRHMSIEWPPLEYQNTLYKIASTAARELSE